MIARYTLPEMAALWSERAKYARWLRVELAVLKAQTELGQVPAEAWQAAQAARVEPERIASLEAEIGHDVLAFVRSLEAQLGPQGRWLHLGLTASDVVDTANALALREAFRLVLAALAALRKTVYRLAREHKTTLMIGRTHGMHAEPITFGLKVLNWFAQLERDRARLEAAAAIACVGKLSGSVGTYANLDPEVERRACEKLGLRPARISSQIVQRDRYAQALAALALLGGSIERIALEVRLLARTEVGELRLRGAHRSSSMPHKRNPITAETLCGLARLLRGYLLAELESVALWHERDISHSSVERVALADAFTLAHYGLVRTREMLEHLEVDAARMRANLEASAGLSGSQAVLLALVRRGLARAEAHERVRALALRASPEKPFRELLQEDELIARYLRPEEIAELLDPARTLRHVEEIFARFEGHHEETGSSGPTSAA